MPTCEDRDEQLFDDALLADDDFSQLFLKLSRRLAEILGGLQIRRCVGVLVHSIFGRFGYLDRRKRQRRFGAVFRPGLDKPQPQVAWLGWIQTMCARPDRLVLLGDDGCVALYGDA